ncbi:PAS domain-containing protein [Flavilitoribacter nigricans]|nr:PAS domain-containing protein [Flavilitoribacter nigricans]
MLDGEVLLLFQNAVKRCLAGESSLAFRNVAFSKAGVEKLANLHFQKIWLEDKRQEIILVEITNVEPSGADGPKDSSPSNQSVIWNQQMKNLEMQLGDANQRAQNLIDEQEATNEELQASNRELMASNEELQSTNEELQSVNEELYTVNSELQLKNDALSQANNDILNLLRSTDIGTIFLDKELQVRRFTPAIRKHFNLLESDIGRPISDFSTTLIGVDISRISRQVYITLDKYEKEVEDTNGNHYLLRVLPYRTQDDLIQGLVITFVDVNELIRIREQMLTFAKKFKAIFQNSDDIILELDAVGDIEEASNGIGPYSKGALVGKNIFEVLPGEETRRLKAELEDMSKKFRPLSFEFEIRDQNELSRYYAGTMIPLGDNPPNGSGQVLVSFVAIMQDITKNVNEQHELTQNLAAYEAFMDNALHQIALIDRDGTIKYLNYAQHTGSSKKEMIGTSIYKYLGDSEQGKVRSSIENIFSGNPFETVRFNFVDKNGREAMIELVATPVIIEERIRYVALIGQESG